MNMQDDLRKRYYKFLENEKKFKRNYLVHNVLSEAMSTLLNYPETTFEDWLEIEKLNLQNKMSIENHKVRERVLGSVIATLVVIVGYIINSSLDLRLSWFLLISPLILMYSFALFTVFRAYNNISEHQKIMQYKIKESRK